MTFKFFWAAPEQGFVIYRWRNVEVIGVASREIVEGMELGALFSFEWPDKKRKVCIELQSEREDDRNFQFLFLRPDWREGRRRVE